MESCAAIVEKEVLLQELESELQEPEQVLDAIEEEDVGAWVDAIAQNLREGYSPISIKDLRQDLGFSLGRIWLGILLGGFDLESNSEFYMSEINSYFVTS